MLYKLDAFCCRLSRLAVVVLALFAVAIIGLCDYLCGVDISLSIFYLLPVAFATWYGGRKTGVAMAILSAITSMGEDLIDPSLSNRFGIAAWNGFLHLGFLLVVAFLLDRLWSNLEIARKLARTDHLTGLANRFAFFEQVQYMIDLATREGRMLTLAYVDIDQFKEVNDGLGHAEGDRLLSTMARHLMDTLRRTDIAGRIGGDEFCVLLPNTDQMGAAQVFEKLRDELSREGGKLSCSIGVVTYITPPPNVDAAIQAADSLMYKVKRQGSNRIAFVEIDSRTKQGCAAGLSLAS